MRREYHGQVARLLSLSAGHLEHRWRAACSVQLACGTPMSTAGWDRLGCVLTLFSVVGLEDVVEAEHQSKVAGFVWFGSSAYASGHGPWVWFVVAGLVWFVCDRRLGCLCDLGNYELGFLFSFFSAFILCFSFSPQAVQSDRIIWIDLNLI